MVNTTAGYLSAELNKNGSDIVSTTVSMCVFAVDMLVASYQSGSRLHVKNLPNLPDTWITNIAGSTVLFMRQP